MKRVWSDGTSAIELSSLELTEKLAAIVPPFRANQVLYAGILAGNAAWRTEVIPKVPSSTEAEREARASLRLLERDGKRGRDKLPDDAPLGWSAGPGPASKEGIRRRRLALPRLWQTNAPADGGGGLPGGVDDHVEPAPLNRAAPTPGRRR